MSAAHFLLTAFTNLSVARLFLINVFIVAPEYYSRYRSAIKSVFISPNFYVVLKIEVLFVNNSVRSERQTG
jgi:hypothetical protein